MRAQTLLAAGATLFASQASAIITGFSVPSTIKAGDDFAVIISTADYIQSVQDVAISFGVAPPQYAFNQTLGTTLLSSQFLGPADSNILTNITVHETIPESTDAGDVVFTGALYSLYGARYSGAVTYFSVNTTIGDATSTTYVSSTEQESS